MIHNNTACETTETLQQGWQTIPNVQRACVVLAVSCCKVCRDDWQGHSCEQDNQGPYRVRHRILENKVSQPGEREVCRNFRAYRPRLSDNCLSKSPRLDKGNIKWD